MAATDWAIDGTLLDVNGQPLDLSNATLTWTLIGPKGLPVLANGDASISVVDSANGIIRISVDNAKTDARMRALHGRVAGQHRRHRLAAVDRRDPRRRQLAARDADVTETTPVVTWPGSAWPAMATGFFPAKSLWFPWSRDWASRRL
jgi:hypothetical protein